MKHVVSGGCECGGVAAGGGNTLFWVDTYYGGEPDVKEDERGSVVVDDVGRA